jgi:hypothetical protein
VFSRLARRAAMRSITLLKAWRLSQLGDVPTYDPFADEEAHECSHRSEPAIGTRLPGIAVDDASLSD